MIGKEISPILTEVEETLWLYESKVGDKPCYTEDGFRAACKIFISAVMDKMWELQERDELDIETRHEMSASCGEEFKRLIKVYTDIDTGKFYR